MRANLKELAVKGLFASVVVSQACCSADNPNAAMRAAPLPAIWRDLPARKVQFPHIGIGRYEIVRPVAGGQCYEVRTVRHGTAADTVMVPAGLMLRLAAVKYEQSGHLKTLDALKSDDLGSLDLEGTEALDEDMTHVAHLTGLSELRLTGTSVTDKGVEKLKPLKKLIRVNWSNIEISNKGLAVLTAFPHMKELNLSGNRLDDGCAQYLARLPNLVTLDLSKTSIKDRGIDELMTSLKSLRSLRLENVRCTDRAIEHIDRLSNLRGLSMPSSKISDASIAYLAKLRNLSSLDVRETQVTYAGVLKLKQALPHCAISYGPRRIEE